MSDTAAEMLPGAEAAAETETTRDGNRREPRLMRPARHARETTRDMSETSDATTARAGNLTRAQRIAAYALLVAVLGAVAGMSWAGTYAWATGTLHWSHAHAVLVPIALDIAAMAAALLALDAISDGESGTTFRALAALFVALSAFTNWQRAVHTGNLAEQIFFPSMSILAYLLAHAVFERIRRRVKRAQQQGGETTRRAVKPLPRLGVLPWLPLVGSPRRALGAVRAAVAERIPETPTGDGETRGTRLAIAHHDIAAEVTLAGITTQADAIRQAIAAVGDSATEVVAWLADRGWEGVAPQRVYDVLRRDRVKALATTGDQPALRDEATA